MTKSTKFHFKKIIMRFKYRNFNVYKKLLHNWERDLQFYLKELFSDALDEKHQDYAQLFSKITDPVTCTSKTGQQNEALAGKWNKNHYATCVKQTQVMALLAH